MRYRVHTCTFTHCWHQNHELTLVTCTRSCSSLTKAFSLLATSSSKCFTSSFSLPMVRFSFNSCSRISPSFACHSVSLAAPFLESFSAAISSCKLACCNFNCDSLSCVKHYNTECNFVTANCSNRLLNYDIIGEQKSETNLSSLADVFLKPSLFCRICILRFLLYQFVWVTMTTNSN